MDKILVAKVHVLATEKTIRVFRVEDQYETTFVGESVDDHSQVTAFHSKPQKVIDEIKKWGSAVSVRWM